MAVFTNAGQGWVVDRLDPATTAGTTDMKWIAWGSDGTAEVVTDTALGAENPEARVAGTISQPQSDQYQVVGEITATANRSVREAGLFSASTAGIMMVRGTHALLNIETNDRVEYTFIVTFKDVSE